MGIVKGKTFRTLLYFLGRISSIQCDNLLGRISSIQCDNLVTFELWAGSSTCLYIFNRHVQHHNEPYGREGKKTNPYTTDLKRWPLKLIEHFTKHYLHFAICRSNGQLSSERSQFNLSFRVRVSNQCCILKIIGRTKVKQMQNPGRNPSLWLQLLYIPRWWFCGC